MRNITISTITSCFKGEKYLAKFLENAAEQTVLDEIEIVLVHNEPTEKEIELVGNFQKKYPDILNHIVIKPVESLPKSMNRCIKEAKGEYVTIWNIDDLRTLNSLEIQKRTLDENPEVALAYGDYLIVRKFGETQKGELVVPPEFDRREFIRSMHCGPFPMWRKEINQKIGYFDEQLIQGADYDLMARIACSYKMKKTKGLLGYYLNEGLGLSTKRTTLQPIERTVIELRYGIFDKIDFWYYKRALKYKISEIFFDDKWFPIGDLVPDYDRLLAGKAPKIFLGLISWPFRIFYRKFKAGIKIIKKRFLNH